MKNMLMGLCIVMALALCGSDGDWFPLPNAIGAGIFMVVAAFLPQQSTPRKSTIIARDSRVKYSKGV